MSSAVRSRAAQLHLNVCKRNRKVQVANILKELFVELRFTELEREPGMAREPKWNWDANDKHTNQVVKDVS